MPIANLESFAISDRVGAVRFDVRARPRAPRTEIVGIKEGALEVAIAAPPADGEANLELARGLRVDLRSPRARRARGRRCLGKTQGRRNAPDRQRGHAGAARRLHQVSARIPKRAHLRSARIPRRALGVSRAVGSARCACSVR